MKYASSWALHPGCHWWPHLIDCSESCESPGANEGPPVFVQLRITSCKLCTRTSQGIRRSRIRLPCHLVFMRCSGFLSVRAFMVHKVVLQSQPMFGTALRGSLGRCVSRFYAPIIASARGTTGPNHQLVGTSSGDIALRSSILRLLRSRVAKCNIGSPSDRSTHSIF